MKANRRKATEHRALVLESVATAPGGATADSVCKDCVGHAFNRHAVYAMLWQLRREGLVGRDDKDTYFLITAGLERIQYGDFTRSLPEYAPRPRARRKQK